MIRASVLAAVLLVSIDAFAPARAAAQASPTVPTDERVYRDIDRLAAAGLIDTIIVGTRPYSQREVLRLLREAQRNLDRLGTRGAWVPAIIAEDEAVYAARGKHGIDEASAEATRLSSPARGIPSDANGKIDATINPLAGNREGRPLANGGTIDLETLHSFEVGRFLALQASPRLSLLSGGLATDDRSNIALQLANATLQFGNATLEVGRDYAVFGQAPNGGLLLSNDAPPLDMIRLANDRPAALPWLFRYLGPAKGELFVADLGSSHQVFPHAKLIGWHVSILPISHLELGAQLIDETGGNGAPGASFSTRAVDLFPLIDVLRHQNTLVSNKLFGMDLRWRAPSLAGLEVYADGAVDDFDARRLRSSLFDDGGYIAGVALHCLVECGRFGVRGEYHQTGIRYYTHGQFTSGVQENGTIIGDPLGPRGLGSYVTLDGDLGRAGYLAMSGAYEVRSGNLYGSQSPAGNDAAFHFVQIAHFPGETRGRLLATWEPGSRQRSFIVGLSAGAERVSNYAFVAGSDRTNAIAQARVVYRP